MLSSITPFGERGRHNRFRVTATAFVIGAMVGGTTLGALCGWLGSWLPQRSSGVDALAVVVLAVAGAVLDASHVPTIKRQVNEDWLGRYRGWVYGIGFGAQLGFGVITVVTSAATYVAFLSPSSRDPSRPAPRSGSPSERCAGCRCCWRGTSNHLTRCAPFIAGSTLRAASGARLGVVAQGLIGVLAVFALVGYA